MQSINLANLFYIFMNSSIFISIQNVDFSLGGTN